MDIAINLLVDFRGYQMCARILPSLLCLLPQTELSRSLEPFQVDRLALCEEPRPEYVITEREVCGVGSISIDKAYYPVFDCIRRACPAPRQL